LTKGSDNNNDALAKIAGDAIPREPEKLKLKGHRAKITRITFHPIYT